MGCTLLPSTNILQLDQGSVVELESMVGEAMDLLVDACLVTPGEGVVVNGNFGIRVRDIVSSPGEHIRRMGRERRNTWGDDR